MLSSRKVSGPAVRYEQAARRLFLEKGYARTSIRDIAEACGVEKTNVQKHFPHKDLFIDHFFEDLLDSSDEFFSARGMLPDNYYQALYYVGQIHFAFLLSTEELRRLTLDIVSDRKLTETMIQLDVRWATQYLEGFSLEEQQTFADNVAVVMGGMYELLYRKLSTRSEVDPESFQQLAMRLFTFVQGIPLEDADRLFPPDLLTTKDFEEAIAFLTKEIFA